MLIVDKKKLYLYFGGLVVAAVLLFALVSGASAGKSNAQDKTVLNGAQSVQKALGYFYNDQNRYPTAEEFQDKNIMLTYLTTFPLPNFVSASCPQSFIYKRITAQSYQLDFCLVRGLSGYIKGWNVLSGSQSLPGQ